MITENEEHVCEKHGRGCICHPKGDCGTACGAGFCGSAGLFWTAIIAGAFVAVGLLFLLELFGIGLDVTAYSAAGAPGTTEAAKAFGFGSYIIIVVAGMIAMFIAGYVSGIIGRPTCTSGCHGIVYGFVTWCLALILSFLLVGMSGNYVGTMYHELINPKGYTTSGPATYGQNHPGPQAGPGFLPGHPMIGAETSRSNMPMHMQGNMPGGPQEASKEFAKGIFLLFLIFLTGALSSAFGGYTAVKRYSRR